MQYYEDIQYIARVGSDDAIQGKIERWAAHQKGILHRAITIAVYINESILLQKRKHPVFDSVFDMTVSTHQLYVDGSFQSDEQTIFQTLKQELFLKPESLTQKPQYKGNITYQAADPKSDYAEHEVCHVYTCATNTLPLFDPAFAYGVKTATRSEIIDQNAAIYHELSPWVKEMIQDGMV